MVIDQISIWPHLEATYVVGEWVTHHCICICICIMDRGPEIFFPFGKKVTLVIYIPWRLDIPYIASTDI